LFKSHCSDCIIDIIKTESDDDTKKYCLFIIKIMLIKYERMRWAVHVERMDGMTGAYRISLGKGEGNKPCGRQRSMPYG